MNAVYEAIRGNVQGLIAFYAKQAKDGLTVEEAAGLLFKAVAVVSECVVRLRGVSKEVKKEAILAAAADLYDGVLAPLDIPGVPDLIERTVVDPAVRKLVLQLVSGAVDALLNFLEQPRIPAPATDADVAPFNPY